MARRWFKERWTQIVPWTIERSTYVLCASLALLLLFWQWRPIGVQIWTVENATARVVLWTLFAAGWATVLVVTFLINHFDLFGLRQVWLPLIGRPYTRVSFRTPLPYRFVRHPLYLGFLLAFWMTPTMTLAHPRVRPGHDRLHRARHPVRGARSGYAGDVGVGGGDCLYLVGGVRTPCGWGHGWRSPRPPATACSSVASPGPTGERWASTT